MNKSYIIFYLLNIIATQIYGAPTPIGNASTVYDVLTTNFSKTCPVLSSNVLVNSTTTYLSCKDVSIINLSEEMSLLNMNKFYCIGMLTAELQLCNIISNNTYTHLPKDFKELQEYIDEIQNMKPEELCTLMKGVNLFNDTEIIPPSIQKSVFTLKEELTGSHCPQLCSEILANKKSNKLCSVLYFIHIQINSASKVIAAQAHKETKPNVTAAIAANSLNEKVLSKQNIPSKQQEIVEDKTSNKIVEQQPKVSNDETPNQLINQSPGDKVKNDSKSENKSIADPPIVDETAPPKVAPVNQQLIPSESKSNKISANSTTDTAPLAVGKNEIPPPAVDKTKLEQPPLLSGEDKTVKTKTTGVVTNKITITPDKNEEPELPDDTEYTTPPPESIVNVKPNSDNEDFIDDDDDDEEKELEETNVEAQKTQEDNFLGGSSNINPMKDSLDVEDSNFFSYFMFISVMFIAGYVVYHNKQKIMALLLEGRRDRNSRRRPSTSSYRKLNSNLEEAVTSKCSGSASHVIY